MGKLYQTYENCGSKIGVCESEGKLPLLPVAHSTQSAQIEAAVDLQGNWKPGEARVISDKKDAVTVIPVTEDSASRSGKFPPPHPLFDKLQYVAGDYTAFGGVKGDRFYKSYIAQLEEWCASPYKNPKVCAVLAYLKKGTLIADLVREKILCCDESGRLLEKWNGKKEDTPEIFRAVSANQSDAFVRFRVVIPGEPESRLWMERDVRDDYSRYYESLQSGEDLCYVTGKKMPRAEKNPAKIRNAGDMAKLISSNDTSGFTFRGRFTEAKQAASVGYETTQKAHNALKWLISKQGIANDTQVIVAWGTEDEPIPPVTGDTYDIMASFRTEEPQTPVSTREEFAVRLNKAIAGYQSRLDDNAQVVVMAVDSATPGRLSIIYYRELQGSDFLRRIQHWHDTCRWLLQYKSVPAGLDKKGKPASSYVSFYGAPAPKDIAAAAYGENAGDKLKRAAVERLLPCIIDKAPVPLDVMRMLASRASNPASMEDWEYRKTLSIACALIRKRYNDDYNYNQKHKTDQYQEVWKMELDTNNQERDYLFGRALAYARKIEEYSVWMSGADPRQTNAERLQLAFSQRPARTWGALYDRLESYMAKFRTKGIGSEGNKYEAGMHKVISAIKREDFDNRPLSPLYLLGYSSQMNAFYEDYEKNKQLKAAKAEQNTNHSKEDN